MEIPLTQGKVAQIDDADWPLVNQHKWYAAKQADGLFYAVTKVWNPETQKQSIMRMHRVIAGVAKGVMVDHNDGDGLNNRRCNLRAATCAQNSRNRRKQINAKWSKFKGVTWVKRDQKWKAAIWINGKYHHLGYFDTETGAAAAYDRAAIEKFGAFARPNFPIAA